VTVLPIPLARRAAATLCAAVPVIVKHDHRYKDGRPHEAVETEALRQTVLIEFLRDRLDELLPEPLSHVLEREQRQRKRLAALLGPTRCFTTVDGRRQAWNE
jgi:hypothetical protein